MGDFSHLFVVLADLKNEIERNKTTNNKSSQVKSKKGIEGAGQGRIVNKIPALDGSG